MAGQETDHIMSEDDSSAVDVKTVIAELEKFFLQADEDGGGGLDEEEFTKAMREANFYPDYDDEELIALHMQIDANCDGTVDFNELLDFNLGKMLAKGKLDFNNRLFPLPIKIVESRHYNKILKIIARPLEFADALYSNGLLKYVENEYITITSDGMLKFWSKRFDKHITDSVNTNTETLPFSHKRKVHVTDMVYIKEKEEVAIATSERELCFYFWENAKLSIKYAIIMEGGRLTALHYWSDGKRTIFAIGDIKGVLHVCVSTDITEGDLFNPKAFETKKVDDYNRVYISSLLRYTTKEYMVLKLLAFDDSISSIKFIPALEDLALCAGSSTKLVLYTLPKTSFDKVNKKIYANPSAKKIFSCMEYCATSQDLVTGGVDGVLQCWYSYKPVNKFQMQQYSKPLGYILDNPKHKVVLAIHEDQTICIWALEARNCLQMIKRPIGPSILSAVHYDLRNNELILANTNVGVLLGKGTDVFKEMLSSHSKPVCSMLYHNIFKQVVSVCQMGDVIVWDIKTGKTVMQFNASPFGLIASTAIALNGPQRKLITVCNDGRVRFWNFNNGQELDVLPVTVPTEISGLVCTEELVFLSAKESNHIYCLDVEGEDAKYLEHPFIEGGVTSMAMHLENGWIVTASGNGIVLVWDIKTLQTLYSINIKESTSVQAFFGKDSKGNAGVPLSLEKETFLIEQYGRIPVPKKLLEEKTDLLEPKQVLRSPLVHCLKGEGHDLTMILVADKVFVSVWPITSTGRMHAKFKAVQDEDADIMCMETDANERILMIGDSKGFVHVWQIEKFCNKQFDSEGPPPLLHSWKAHNGAITGVSCNPSCQNFFTAGFDCNVNSWTNKQRLVGTFGKDQWEVQNLHPDWVAQTKDTEEDDDYLQKYQVQRKTDRIFWQYEEEEQEPSKLVEYQSYLHDTKELIQNLKQSRRDFEMQRSIEEVQEHKEVPQPCEVKHFLEKKQHRDLPLMYKYPLMGPVSEEQLTECGHKHINNMQLRLEETPPTRKVKVKKMDASQDLPKSHSALGANAAAHLKNYRSQNNKVAKEVGEPPVKDAEDTSDHKPEFERWYPLETQKKCSSQYNYSTKLSLKEAGEIKDGKPTKFQSGQGAKKEVPKAEQKDDAKLDKCALPTNSADNGSLVTSRATYKAKRGLKVEKESSDSSREYRKEFHQHLLGHRCVKVLEPSDCIIESEKFTKSTVYPVMKVPEIRISSKFGVAQVDNKTSVRPKTSFGCDRESPRSSSKPQIQQDHRRESGGKMWVVTSSDKKTQAEGKAL